MEYACLGGGKRFRATLVYACGVMAKATLDELDTPACAVEMVHAYSLVHDDLPAMDNDVLRRGRPTCHVAFDEATAVLAGDALQSRAFEILASPQTNILSAGQRCRMLEELSKSIGSMGMAGGQALDMEATGRKIENNELMRMHQLKTGALVEAAAVMGGLAGPDSDHRLLDSLREYARSIGLAFQIADDILDWTSDSDTLGKITGADSRMGKATCISTLGLEEARAEAANLSRQAIETLNGLGDNARFLKELAKFAINRNY